MSPTEIQNQSTSTILQATLEAYTGLHLILMDEGNEGVAFKVVTPTHLPLGTVDFRRQKYASWNEIICRWVPSRSTSMCLSFWTGLPYSV